MRADRAHRADVADRELLMDIDAACRWWNTQRTWRVSSSYTGGGVIARLEESVASRVAGDAIGLALPSATAALVTALRAIRVTPGSTLGVPAVDWTLPARRLSPSASAPGHFRSAGRPACSTRTS